MAEAPREQRRIGRRLWHAAQEFGWNAGQFLLFFALFLWVLQLSLPKGTGLVSLYDDLGSSRERAGLVALNGETVYDLGPLATLTATKRRVKDRPADGVAWTDASEGMELGDRHAIQTLKRSGATITFNNDNTLWLDENSLVVIKRPTRGPRRARRASLTVLGGSVRGTVLPGAGGGGELDVETAGGDARIRSSGEESTEFVLKVNEDQSQTVAVLSGLAEIEKQGRKVQLAAQQAMRIDASGALSNPVAIPDPPSAEFPVEGHVHTTGPSTPPLEFRWRAARGADSYRLQIARDAAFSDLVFDTTTADTSIRPANLGPGRYHWRAASIADQAEGDPGTPNQVEIVGDTEAPALAVELPKAAVASDRLEVRGRAEPGSRVLIGGADVDLAADGSFVHEVSLERGPNLIAIEAVDPAGNVTYHSQYVYAKY